MKLGILRITIFVTMLLCHFSICFGKEASDPNGSSKYHEAVYEAADKVFIDGQLPPCVRDTISLTREEFEQKLGELYNSNPLVRELVNHLDDLAEYIKTRQGYQEAAPFISYDEISFSVNGKEYGLVLSPRDALSLLRGFVSGDCTSLVQSFAQYVPAHLLSPSFLSFRVIRKDDNYWIGNVYTVVAKTEDEPVLIIDALQLPWHNVSHKDGMAAYDPKERQRNYIKKFPIESLEQSEQISQGVINALIEKYTPKVHLQEVWLGFTSNFRPLVDYCRDIIYRDYPSKPKSFAGEFLNTLTIEDSNHVESFDSPHRFIKIWPQEKVDPLHIAALAGDLAKLRALIEEGADVNAKNMWGETALHYAAERGHKEVVELLIAKGADISAGRIEALQYAIDNGHTEVAILLINKGANVNPKTQSGWTPLHSAVEGDYKQVAEILLAKGAYVNSKDKKGFTPFRYALWYSKADIARLLVEKGADVHEKDQFGYTPLHWAVMMGYRELTELLLAKGADPNAKGKAGETPLDFASYPGIARLLIEKGAELSSLQSAAFIGDLDKVKALIDEGTDVNKKDTVGVTALHAAVAGGHKDMTEFLILKGADVSTSAMDGQTPLHWAADKGRRDIVELLIDKGAKVNAKDNAGQTPLQLAENRKNIEIVQLLKKHGAKE
jgi:ankyrin repeat protein